MQILNEQPPLLPFETNHPIDIEGEFRIGNRKWRTSQAFETYWQFATSRQEIFFRRLEGRYPLTLDPILGSYKFTNAYRASDRVSQYMIRNVAYRGSQEPAEVFFRIILFKLFNKIETWELLVRELGEISYASYKYDTYRRLLDCAFASGTRIYSNAYIMPSGGKHAKGRKHNLHLKLLQKMMDEGVPETIHKMGSMEEAFRLLRSYPMIGDFLAYQYVTDLNYSCLCNFSEMEFVVAGPGAKDGIRKCFPDLPLSLASEAIQAVCEQQDQEFSHRSLPFRGLWGRPLQLIDCQNLFCEVDKYCRVALPHISGLSDRTRIKQHYRPTNSVIEVFYPPKWNIVFGDNA